MSLLPPDDHLDLLHTRDYEVRAYGVSSDEMLVRGAVSDRKPPNLYIADDPDELEIHQMHIEMRVRVPSLEILSIQVGFESHPTTACPSIADHYRSLIGLSIARGYTVKVRELFGGPRGCTHTNALLLAIGPAVVQATWSLRARGDLTSDGAALTDAQKAELNLNTCHVWADDGEMLTAIRRGEDRGMSLLPVSERLVELGRDPDDWTLGSG